MTRIKQAIAGELLYFYPEELTILIVMNGDDGVRYVEPMNLKFDNNGNIITTYISYDALSEWTISLGTVSNISERLTEKKSY